jgi:two-component system, OmpR family, phosphate regulon response regulator OmpR
MKLPDDDAAHLLVVDDDKRIRELLSRFLGENGFRVTVAANAAEARKALDGMDFDLMILDIMMPGETGLSLARAMQSKRPVPILLLTALTDTDDRIAGLSAGAEDYLAKPFDPRELLLRLKNILKRARVEAPAAVDKVGFETIARHELSAEGSDVSERTIDVQINRLRRKIETDPANPVFLQTVRGIGYRLMAD